MSLTWHMFLDSVTREHGAIRVRKYSLPFGISVWSHHLLHFDASAPQSRSPLRFAQFDHPHDALAVPSSAMQPIRSGKTTAS